MSLFQEIYLSVYIPNDGANPAANIRIVLGTGTVARKWKIKVRMIECNSLSRYLNMLQVFIMVCETVWNNSSASGSFYKLMLDWFILKHSASQLLQANDIFRFSASGHKCHSHCIAKKYIGIHKIPFIFVSAPDGCLQYYTGTGGQIISYNGGEPVANPQQIINTHYTVCIRQEEGIKYFLSWFF